MKKQLLLMLALAAALPMPILAIKYDAYSGQDFAEGAYEDMPNLRELGTVDNTLSWGILPHSLLEHQSPWNLRIATSHLASALYLAMGYEEGKTDISIKNMETGETLNLPRQEKTSHVRDLTFSPEDPHVLAVARADNTLQTIDTQTGETLVNFDTEGAQIVFSDYCPSFSADGNFLTGKLKKKDKKSGQNIYKYGVWDAHTGKLLELRDDILFSEDQSILANGSGFNITKARDERLHCAVSPRSEKLAVVNSKSELNLYSLKNGSKNYLMELPSRTKKGEHSALSFSPDGTFLAATGSTDGEVIIEIWNTESGEKIAEIPESGYIHSIIFSPDNQQILYCKLTKYDYPGRYLILLKNIAEEKDRAENPQWSGEISPW